MSLQELVDISRFYGSNKDYVIAGGGNTSFKDGTTLYIKGSGTTLQDITGDGFVRMDRDALRRIWGKQYSQNTAERESAVLADMMAAKMSGEEQKRPSVETLLHDILPFTFVVHTHPALVNGITCSVQGETAMRELFGDETVWIPSTNPGYILSLTVKEAMNVYTAKKGHAPAVIFLQNHGIFVGADNVAGIKAHYAHIMEKIGSKIKRRPDMSLLNPPHGTEKTAETLSGTAKELAGSSGWAALFYLHKETAALVKSRAAFAPVSSAFTPDHIVYAGSEPLYIENETQAEAELKAFYKKNNRFPKTVAVQGIGVFGLGKGEKAASLSMELFSDAVKVSVYTESFGGPQFMTPEQIDFINNWEVEQYRSKVSAG
jgi:rhamnose utilization protein RhaD (predicted bifunctional aldolase and dehydrogenase)